MRTLGPSVIFTALEKISTPRSIRSRASVEKRTSLADRMSRRKLLRVPRQPHTGEVPGHAPDALSCCPSALELIVSSRTCQPGGQSPVLARGVGRHPKLRVDLRKIPGLSPFVLLSAIWGCWHCIRLSLGPADLGSTYSLANDETAPCFLVPVGTPSVFPEGSQLATFICNLFGVLRVRCVRAVVARQH